MPSYLLTKGAVNRLARHARSAGYEEFNPDEWFPWILETIRALMFCYPQPLDAFEHVTWRPWKWSPFSAVRLRWHRQNVLEAARRNVIHSSAPGGTEQALEVLWKAVDAEEVTQELFFDLYREARAGG